MEEKSNVTKLTQKDYQKKYDEKTQSVTIKYTPADMPDFDRMMKYLDRTGKSRSSFIKELINDFFESISYQAQEEKIAEYYRDYNVDDEHLEKLEQLVGKQKYKIIMNIHGEQIISDLTMVFEEYGLKFEEWIDQLEEDINNGEFNVNLPDDKFKKMIDKSLCDYLGIICYV